MHRQLPVSEEERMFVFIISCVYKILVNVKSAIEMRMRWQLSYTCYSSVGEVTTLGNEAPYGVGVREGEAGY